MQRFPAHLPYIASGTYVCFLPATDPPDQQRIVNYKLDHRVQLLLSLVHQTVQLLESNREGVRTEPP